MKDNNENVFFELKINLFRMNLLNDEEYVWSFYDILDL